MRGCRPLSDPEVSRVMRNFQGRDAARDRALFVLGVKSGFRISEMLGLQVRDLLHRGRVTERVTVRRRLMKGRREGRTVLLHPEAQMRGTSIAKVIEDVAGSVPVPGSQGAP